MTDLDSEYYLAQCNEKDMEIERLRQHVKELEQVQEQLMLTPCAKQLAALEAMIAELRKLQGEPVGEVIRVPPHFLGIKFSYPGVCVPGQKLYASAPSIPEDWRLVPVEPTPEMLEATCGENTPENLKKAVLKLRREDYITMITNAPKYGK